MGATGCLMRPEVDKNEAFSWGRRLAFSAQAPTVVDVVSPKVQKAAGRVGISLSPGLTGKIAEGYIGRERGACPRTSRRAGNDPISPFPTYGEFG
jgi:hypothetical protein